MRKARFTEHQIIAVIKSVESGWIVKDVCREAGISEATYYNWLLQRIVQWWIIFIGIIFLEIVALS